MKVLRYFVLNLVSLLISMIFLLSSVQTTEAQNEYVWSVGGGGTIVNTTNSGLNWSTQTSGTSYRLLDVDFLTTNIGWTVGFNGTILNTTDGGANWTSQTSGTTNNLSSIYFLDTNTGWAVGEITSPTCLLCQGSILQTILYQLYKALLNDTLLGSVKYYV